MKNFLITYRLCQNFEGEFILTGAPDKASARKYFTDHYASDLVSIEKLSDKMYEDIRSEVFERKYKTI